MPNHYIILLQIIFLVNYNLATTGDRARLECAKNGIKMIDCHRILYGVKTRVPADLLEFPHMAIIGYNTEINEKWMWNCGGSLISSDWVLTAAHCLKDPRAGPPKVVMLGISTFDEEDIDEDLMQIRKVIYTISHPNYKPPVKYNDIALLKLNEPIQLGNDIRIACLETEDYVPKSAIASGFGKTSIDNMFGSSTMMLVEINIISNEACNNSLRSIFKKRRSVLPKGILKSQLCAGDIENGGKDTCQGDSGGPLQILPKNPDCKKSFPLYTILAVTSFGRFCGFRNSPGVYTRVSQFISWIEDIVWPLK